MPIDLHDNNPVAVFLFAHQDDEFAVYQQIQLERQSGRRVICIYLTSGAPAGMDPAQRELESSTVLGYLGVPRENIVFAGRKLGIPDLHMQEYIPEAAAWLHGWLTSGHPVESIYVPCWEGGHPDHDSVHAIAVQIGTELELAHRIRQFPLYNGAGLPGPLFRLQAPLRRNGHITSTRIPWNNRIRFLKYALCYLSQRSSWVGLFPHLVLHYIFHGSQYLQPVNLQRISEPPHQGTLYYERRGFSSWPTLSTKLNAWIRSRHCGTAAPTD